MSTRIRSGAVVSPGTPDANAARPPVNRSTRDGGDTGSSSNPASSISNGHNNGARSADRNQ